MVIKVVHIIGDWYMDVDDGERSYVVGDKPKIRINPKTKEAYTDSEGNPIYTLSDPRYFGDVKSCVECVMKIYQRKSASEKRKQELCEYMKELREINKEFQKILDTMDDVGHLKDYHE
jgi:hypothetical protein